MLFLRHDGLPDRRTGLRIYLYVTLDFLLYALSFLSGYPRFHDLHFWTAH